MCCVCALWYVDVECVPHVCAFVFRGLCKCKCNRAVMRCCVVVVVATVGLFSFVDNVICVAVCAAVVTVCVGAV